MGEFELLARVRERLPPPGGRVRVGSGDDAAVTVPGGATATSVDALVEGVHFSRDGAGLGQVGSKALAAALSDLAAMGAEPGEAYVVLDRPARARRGRLPRGRRRDGRAWPRPPGPRSPAATSPAARFSPSRSPWSGMRRPRSASCAARGARPGDALVLTGELGGAAAGLLLAEPRRRRPRRPRRPPRCAARQLEPVPRLAAGRALAAAGATAMIDVSDGLGADAGHLAAAERRRPADRRRGAAGRRGGRRGRRRAGPRPAAAGGLRRRGLRAAGGAPRRRGSTWSALGEVGGGRDDPDRRGRRRRGGRDQAARGPDARAGWIRPLGLSDGGSSASSSRTPRRLSIASAISAGLGR